VTIDWKLLIASLIDDGSGPRNVMKMGVDTSDDRQIRFGSQSAEGIVHFLNAFPRINRNDALGATHKGLIGQPIPHKTPSMITH
jgi:hypothetical protein